MAKRKQWRRGTNDQHVSFTGAVGEVTVDTDLNTLVVHDGVTPGGHPIPKAIGHLGGIDLSAAPLAGDLLLFDGTNWIAGLTAMAALGDVDLSIDATDGQVLAYDASTETWKPTTVSGAGSATKTFRINFGGASPTNIDNAGTPVQDLPSGWSMVSATTATVTIQHDQSNPPKEVWFHSKRSTGEYRIIYPAGSTYTTYNPSTPNQFTVNCVAGSAQSEANQHVIVHLIF